MEAQAGTEAVIVVPSTSTWVRIRLEQMSKDGIKKFHNNAVLINGTEYSLRTGSRKP